MRVSKEHPTFANPIINEALCEIHFTLPDGVLWESSIYGQFFTLIQEEFPLIEPVPGAYIRMRYRHAARALMLQLSEGLLTVNLLPKYLGWQQMQQDILHGWSSLREILGPVQVTRIGLRYINFVPIANPEETLATWFAPNAYVAEAVLQAHSSSSAIEVQMNDKTKAIVQLGEIANIKDENDRKFLLDIDAITITAPGTVMTLAETITQLHDEIIWTIFDSFRTANLNRLLNGE